MADDMEIDTPHGTKRKAVEELNQDEPVDQPRRIRALDPDVINKIAAGEIIVAPVHALKELIENAVDAGSTSLEVLVKEGGLKLLQITDNGSGIDKEDLPILCERFTTSKLQKFEDLQSIATYGFRGEALASISHIAHLTVTTKTKESNCAWRAHYSGGKLVPAKPGHTSDPRPTAGRQGTQIMVEDLFYNVPTRRRAFRSASDEYGKIVDMVGRYAVHCNHVAFSCRKSGESSTSISIQANASATDRIRQIHGGGVANELVEFSTSDHRWGFKANGLVTNANYSVKKTTLLLFINHRCVESTNIRKAVEQTYSVFLPKNGHPFVYLSLEIDPHRVDVNVHPTKREVNFLNGDEITQAICEHIRSKLATVDTSRTFLTQTLLGSGVWADPNEQSPDATRTRAKADGPSSSRRSTRPDETKLVRTDTNMRKITSMLPRSGTTSSSSRTRAAAGDGAKDADAGMLKYEVVERQAEPCRLSSIRELRTAVRDDMHHELTEIFANHTFVGVVDERRRLAAIQGGVKLYLVDYGRICFEYLYQVGLTDFGNFGTIQFSPPLDLRELLRGALEIEKLASVADRDGDEDEDEEEDEEDVDVAEVADSVAEQLIERHEMLSEYFSLEINPAGELVSIPLLVKGYMPPIVKLPRFLLLLGPNVDWSEEKACFESFLKELATFYVPEQLPPEPSDGEEQASDEAEVGQVSEEGRLDKGKGKEKEEGKKTVPDEIAARRKYVRWALEHVFFPAFKAKLVATRTLMKGGVLEVANLKGLYRVFERC